MESVEQNRGWKLGATALIQMTFTQNDSEQAWNFFWFRSYLTWTGAAFKMTSSLFNDFWSPEFDVWMHYPAPFFFNLNSWRKTALNNTRLAMGFELMNSSLPWFIVLPLEPPLLPKSGIWELDRFIKSLRSYEKWFSKNFLNKRKTNTH